MSDLISRQAAIELCDWYQHEFCECDYAFGKLSIELAALPPAQPEIIKCKDCKWWDKSDDSPFGYCMAMKHGYMSTNWEIGIYRRYKGEFYCADAERRTDDER